MSYASQDQLVGRFGESMLVELTDRADPPAGAIDNDVVAQALGYTDALIDGYLLGRYKLPLATTPPILTDLALAISIYKLHINAASDKIVSDYNAAIGTLKAIASGTVRLDVEGVEPPSSGGSGVRTNDRTRDMTPRNLKGFV